MIVPYSMRRRTFILNRGTSSLDVDLNNCVLAPLASLLTRCAPETVLIVASRRPLLNLLFLKSLFHSGICAARIVLFVPNYLREEEGLRYLVSKVFGHDLVLCRRKVTGRGTVHVYALNRPSHAPPVDVSFNLLSDGRAPERLARAIDSIRKQNIAQYEINLIGPAHCHAEWRRVIGGHDVRCVADDAIYAADRRFPIGRKKNLALGSSRGNVIVIMHDRIWLSERWYERLRAHGGAFDLYACRVEAKGGIRYLDKVAMRWSQYLFYERRMYYLTYRESNVWQTLDGGFMVLNTRSLGDCRFDDRLHWNEMEDVDFVARQRLNGNAITFDRFNHVYSDFTRHFHLEPGLWPSVKKLALRRTRLGDWLLQAQCLLRSSRM